jgi:FOG: WD40 repeat
MSSRIRFLAPTAVFLLIGGAAATGFSYYRSAHIRHPVTNAPLVVPGRDGDATLLHSGWKISPAGRLIKTGDMLYGACLSPDGRTVAIVHGGYNPNGIQLFDVATEKPVFEHAALKMGTGVAWAPDGKRLYLSGGANNGSPIQVLTRGDDGAWKAEEGLKLPGAEVGKTYVPGSPSLRAAIRSTR